MECVVFISEEFRENTRHLVEAIRCKRESPIRVPETQSAVHPRTTKRFPSSRCASAIQIVRPLESIAETQPQLQPALLRLSAIWMRNINCKLHWRVAIRNLKFTNLNSLAGVLAQLVERLNGINARLIFSLYPHLI